MRVDPDGRPEQIPPWLAEQRTYGHTGCDCIAGHRPGQPWRWRDPECAAQDVNHKGGNRNGDTDG